MEHQVDVMQNPTHGDEQIGDVPATYLIGSQDQKSWDWSWFLRCRARKHRCNCLLSNRVGSSCSPSRYTAPDRQKVARSDLAACNILRLVAGEQDSPSLLQTQLVQDDVEYIYDDYD